jgi:hypothetical protein
MDEIQILLVQRLQLNLKKHLVKLGATKFAINMQRGREAGFF